MAKENLTALITGGSRGIGAAICKRLAMLGIDISFTYINSDDIALKLVNELESYEVKAKCYKVNSADVVNMQALAEIVYKEFGRIDILINNADSVKINSILNLTNEEINESINKTIIGPMILSRECAKLMINGGRIINISSVKAKIVGMPNISLHVLGKSAWISFSKSWAHDLANKGITVNSILPGPIKTDLNPGTGANGDYNRNRTALKRYGEVEDVANMVEFLISSSASYITGSEFNVDGGFNA